MQKTSEERNNLKLLSMLHESSENVHADRDVSLTSIEIVHQQKRLFTAETKSYRLHHNCYYFC